MSNGKVMIIHLIVGFIKKDELFLLIKKWVIAHFIAIVGQSKVVFI